MQAVVAIAALLEITKNSLSLCLDSLSFGIQCNLSVLVSTFSNTFLRRRSGQVSDVKQSWLET
jgi:hypothetical protein